MREIVFLVLVSRPKKVEEDRLVNAVLAEFKAVPMNRRFSAAFLRYIEPGASGGQNVRDAVDQPAGITPGSTDMRLCWREVFLNDLPELIANFPEYCDYRLYLRELIIIGHLAQTIETTGRRERGCGPLRDHGCAGDRVTGVVAVAVLPTPMRRPGLCDDNQTHKLTAAGDVVMT